VLANRFLSPWETSSFRIFHGNCMWWWRSASLYCSGSEKEPIDEKITRRSSTPTGTIVVCYNITLSWDCVKIIYMYIYIERERERQNICIYSLCSQITVYAVRHRVSFLFHIRSVLCGATRSYFSQLPVSLWLTDMYCTFSIICSFCTKIAIMKFTFHYDGSAKSCVLFVLQFVPQIVTQCPF